MILLQYHCEGIVKLQVYEMRRRSPVKAGTAKNACNAAVGVDLT